MNRRPSPAGRFRLAAVLGTTALLMALVVPTADAASPVCGRPEANPTLGTYAIVSSATAELAVWRHPSGRHEIPVSIDGCTLVVDSQHPHKIAGFVHEFEDSAGDTIPNEDIDVQAVPTGKTSASVYLTLKTRKGLAAGKYSGTLQLDNTEEYGHSLTIPATITLQYTPFWFAFLIPWVLTLSVGTLGVYLKYRVAAQKFITPATVLALGLAVGAAGTVWKTQYLTVGSWGGSLSDFWGLFLLMLSAYVAAGTTVSLATDSVRGKGWSRAQAPAQAHGAA